MEASQTRSLMALILNPIWSMKTRKAYFLLLVSND